MKKRICFAVACLTLVSGLAYAQRKNQRAPGGRWAAIGEVLKKHKSDNPDAHAKLMKLRTSDPRAFRTKVGELLRTAAEKDPELKKRLNAPRSGNQRTGSFKTPDSVTVARDIVYATYGKRKVMLDMYLPKNPPAGKIPCIMTIHGGGWRNGDKNKFARFASKFAENGFAAACIGYRLMPEVKVPQCVQDAKASVRWVRANAKKYNIDPDRIGAFGGSAGAHLAAMLGTSFKVEKLEGNGGNKGVSSKVHAVVALATPADMTAFPRHAGNKETARLISPANYVDKDSAKFLLIHAEGDGVVPYKQSIILQEKLTKASVVVQLTKIEGRNHAFWNGNSPTAQKTVADTITFFQKTLKHPKPKTDK
ncbi:MAG: alpha/beta hydrolase [Phycisphaerae bacterium]|jgi:acetyl esterase/lipase|nr:alpha/beta hydrolase [Phycisphaerae bacterium]